MARIFKFEIADMPKVYLVGRESKYNIQTYIQGDNRIPAFWDKCLADGTFKELEKQWEFLYEPGYAGATINWDMGYGRFSYVCGMLYKEGVTVPEGYVMHEIGDVKVGKCWIKGRDSEDVTSNAHALTMQAIRDQKLCPNQLKWSMEIFNGQRFLTPDENGEIILDYYIPLAKSFESLGKRVIYPYLAAYPDFKAVCSNSACENSQRQMYDFLYESINAIYADLSLIGIPYEDDDCYEYWQPGSSKPELGAKMQNIRKTFLTFFEYLIRMGLAGEAVQEGLLIKKDKMIIQNRMKNKLSLFGLTSIENKDGYFFTHNKYKEIFPAWKFYCGNAEGLKINPKDVHAFLHGYVEGKQITAAGMFGRIRNADLISRLEGLFIQKGYNCKYDHLRVVYEKEYPDKQKAHMNIYYDYKKLEQMIFEFKSPQLSKVLKYYDQMDDELKTLVFSRTKICDGCGYCTQTDRSGKRKRLAVTLELDGERKSKCPLFPSFVWDNANEEMIKTVKKLFDFSEGILYGN